MAKNEVQVGVKLPTPAKLEQIRDALEHDEDFRFGRIRLSSKKPRYELAAPTEDDRDATESVASFFGVVVLARKNKYQSDEEKAKGTDPNPDKRTMYILRCGKYVPEILYTSPTAIQNWRGLIRDATALDMEYMHVLIEFTAEYITGKVYKWSIPQFKVVRPLTDEEIDHIEEMYSLVEVKAKVAENWEENADLEDAALARRKPALASKKEEEPVAEETTLDKKSSSLDADAEPETATPPKATRTRKAREPEETEEAPKSAGRVGYPSLEDE